MALSSQNFENENEFRKNDQPPRFACLFSIRNSRGELCRNRSATWMLSKSKRIILFDAHEIAWATDSEAQASIKNPTHTDELYKNSFTLCVNRTSISFSRHRARSPFRLIKMHRETLTSNADISILFSLGPQSHQKRFTVVHKIDFRMRRNYSVEMDASITSFGPSAWAECPAVSPWSSTLRNIESLMQGWMDVAERI